MKEITLEQLLEAGSHFGHQVTRQNPKAREYVFEARDGIHIIDLGLTKKGLDEAAAFIKVAAQQGGALVVVGSKRQAQPIVLAEVKKAKEALAEKGIDPELFTVTSRWIGGTLTNVGEVHKNYKKLRDLEANLKDDFTKAKYTKKEIGMWDKERQKLEMYYGGIADIKGKPAAVFIIDTHTEELAVKEAARTHTPIVGIVDTNADPDFIDYVIPANDDAVGSLQLIISHIIQAWTEGKMDAKNMHDKEEKTANAETTEKTLKTEETANTESTKKKQTTEKKEAPKEKKITKKATKSK